MNKLMTKHCLSCGQVKPVDDFHKCSRNKCGRQSSCKSCKRKLSERRYSEKRDHILKVSKEWSKLNEEKHNQLRRDWRKRSHDGRMSSLTKSGHAPKWLTEEDRSRIKAIYMEARRVGLVVDHIIPLRGDTVCGLHVPANLQLLTYKDNQAKSNSF
jgi:hypothetical protein